MEAIDCFSVSSNINSFSVERRLSKMHQCIVKSVFACFLQNSHNFTQFTLDAPQWFRQCGAGPGLATDNLPGREAELGTRASD